MAQFTPPVRNNLPTVLASDQNAKPFSLFKPSIGRGVNVFIDVNNVVTESQPIWTNIKTAFYGGHTYDLTGEQYDLLIAAGYGANIA